MTVIKIIFSMLICFPLLALAYYFLKKLVEELASREAVEKITVEPYEEYSITVGNQKINDGGPIVILRIWD